MLSLLVASALAAAPATPATPEVLQELRGIESASMRGKADDLRIKYQDQARGRPSDILLRVYIAWTVLPSDDAWNQLKAIAALNPDNPWVHLGMGRTYTAWKMRDQAKSELGPNEAFLEKPVSAPLLREAVNRRLRPPR